MTIVKPLIAAVTIAMAVTGCAGGTPTHPTSANPSSARSSAPAPSAHTSIPAPGYITVTNPNDPDHMSFTIHGNVPPLCIAAIHEWDIAPPAITNPTTNDDYESMGIRAGAMIVVSKMCADVPTQP